MQELTSAPAPDGAGASASGSSVGRTLRVALIDNDSGFLHVLGKRFERAGWQQRVLASPVPVEDLVAMRLGALVVDVAVLGPQAWEYLEKVATRMPGLGIIVCTGQSSVAQRVRGLRLGADDWVSKPCHPDELMARIEAVARRRRRVEPQEETRPRMTGELEIRGDQFQAFVAGQSAELTKREFELIDLLATAEGRVLEREEIYQRVWGYAMARGDRSVDVFVRKLRQKLDKASPSWRYIHTHFGVGYRFAPEPAADVVAEPERPAGRVRTPEELLAEDRAAALSGEALAAAFTQRVTG
jgi:DNA-binding response OmpR family regulator